MFAYTDPVSFRAWNDPNDLAAGEIYFDHEPSASELAAAFPNYVAPPPPVPQSISPRQFYQQLAVQSVITQDAALAYVQTGAIPAAMEALVASLPSDQQFAAKMKIIGAGEYLRSDPITVAFGAAQGMTSTQLDTLWTAASAL